MKNPKQLDLFSKIPTWKKRGFKSEDEFKKKIVEYRKEVSIFRKDRQNLINDFNQKKIKEFNEFFKKITHRNC